MVKVSDPIAPLATGHMMSERRCLSPESPLRGCQRPPPTVPLHISPHCLHGSTREKTLQIRDERQVAVKILVG